MKPHQSEPALPFEALRKEVSVTQQQVVPIIYIGGKVYKTDNINHTKTVWNGQGDVQPYPLDMAAALLRHSDVWKLGKASDLQGPLVVDDAGAVRESIEAPRVATMGDLTKSTRGPTMGQAAREGPDAAASGKSARTLE